jgi:hypothetical protein
VAGYALVAAALLFPVVVLVLWIPLGIFGIGLIEFERPVLMDWTLPVGSGGVILIMLSVLRRLG